MGNSVLPIKPDHAFSVRSAAPRVACVALVGSLLVVLLGDRLDGFDVGAFWGHVESVAAYSVAAAILLTVISYLAVACYDVLAFDMLGRRLPVLELLKSGVAATGLGQALGFGVLVGGFARWRLLRRHGVTPVQAASASVVVASGFFLGLFTIFAILALMMPQAAAEITRAGETATILGSLALVLTIFAGIYAASRGAKVALFGRTISLPDPRFAYMQIILAICDVLPAGLALWILLPAELEIGLPIILLAYVSALGAGLLSNMPSGLGAFEAVFLLAIPGISIEALVAGLVCFRAIYYGLPLCIAITLLVRSEMSQTASGRRWPILTFLNVLRSSLRDPSFGQDAIPTEQIDEAVNASERAESHLAFLGDKLFLSSREHNAFIMYARCGGTLLAVGDPVGPRRSWPALIDDFAKLARSQRRSPAFYKIGRTAASICAAHGLAIDRLGHEAIINVKDFDLGGPERRELRRKIKGATKQGIEISFHKPGSANLDELAQVADAWRTEKHGRERSFSMGHFDPGYLRRFPLLAATHQDRTVAFVSIWQSGDGSEWSLDLMRIRPDAPPGTIHALIGEAIERARTAEVARFNLCMAPLGGLDDPQTPIERLGARFFAHGGRFHDLQGLYRFKKTFRPIWQPRYLARAPGPAAVPTLVSAYRLTARPLNQGIGTGCSPSDWP